MATSLLTYYLSSSSVWHIRLAQDLVRLLCLVFSLLMFNTSTQQPSVLSVLCSPCCCSTRQPSRLQFSLSCVLLAAVQHVNPAAFSSLCLVFSLLLFNTSTQQPSVLLPLFVATLFLACLFFCFLLALFCWQVVAHPVDMTKPCPLFQDQAYVLLLCCLVESGVGDGLGPVHFQYLP